VTTAEDNPQRTWHFKQLRSSLRSLAAAGSGQPSLFPDQTRTPDELAFDFDHWLDVVRSNYEGELEAAQAEALDAIAKKLSTMSRDGAEFDVDLWTEAAFGTSEHWAEVRRLADAALKVFDQSD
jgi:hypothetical protein